MTNKMKNIFIFLGFIMLFQQKANAQGCVAVRQMSCSSSVHGSSSDLFKQKNGTWLVSTSYRYFKSFRHFRGTEEETNRVENGTQVVNISHGLDLGISYLANPRVSFNANLPLIYFDRSSLYEHYGNSLTANPEQKRFRTGSQGIGDLRLSASYWVLNPAKILNGNLSIGLGVKLPTGNPGVKGDFHKLTKDGTDYLITKPVDQSIQLGDGRVGLSVESQGYRSFGKHSSLYYNAYYLLNPAETNGVERDPSNVNVDPIIKYFSVADQFAVRVGANQSILPKSGVSIMLGGRLEGVTAKDLIGGNEGFRRPGYVVAVEPGLAYMKGKISATATVPVALYRNRTKSYYDLQDPTGQRHGDAAFADYSINFSISKWF